MKALIISDIHSNIYGLEAVYKKEKDSDIIYCAGDLVDYGPFPKEVIEWIRDHEIVTVKGNHDEDVINAYRQGKTLSDIPEEERRWVDHNADQLDDKHIEFLERLPEHVSFTLDGYAYAMKHRFGQNYETVDNAVEFRRFWTACQSGSAHDQALQSEKRGIFGHTHFQAIHYVTNDELWLNPGSVSYRKKQKIDHSRDAQYMTITNGKIDIKSVEYDMRPMQKAFHAIKLSEQQFQASRRIFEEVEE